MSIKFNFSNDSDDVKIINDYKLSDEELKEINDINDNDDIECIEEETIFGEEEKKQFKKPSKKQFKNRSEIDQASDLQKLYRQRIKKDVRNKDCVNRTYLIELDNIKRLEEIKLKLHKNKFVQLSEIINDAIECYYNSLKK